MENNFKAKAGEWEGPLEVLLDLIEKKKLHISAVSLAEITDDYVEYLNTHQNFQPATVAQFVLIASTLISGKYFSPIFGGRIAPLTVSPVFKPNNFICD